MNALLLVDKPAGMTSHDVVARVRRVLHEPSVGHLGTLDPLATGLLPMLAGKWTRLAQFYGAMEKGYTGVIRFGYATDTFDADGVPQGAVRRASVELAQLQHWAAALLGEQLQQPPPYSAKKLGGKPAYASARSGGQPALKAVPVTVHAFAFETLRANADGTADADFQLRISSGGYVRSIAQLLGQQAGCGAHLLALRRVQAGALRLRDALTLPQLESLVAAGELAARLPHPRCVLPEMPAVQADAGTLQRMRNGAVVCLPEFSDASLVRVFGGQRELAGVARRLAGVLFQPHVVLG